MFPHKLNCMLTGYFPRNMCFSIICNDQLFTEQCVSVDVSFKTMFQHFCSNRCSFCLFLYSGTCALMSLTTETYILLCVICIDKLFYFLSPFSCLLPGSQIIILIPPFFSYLFMLTSTYQMFVKTP